MDKKSALDVAAELQKNMVLEAENSVINVTLVTSILLKGKR
jgi:hypothetical protein